MQKWSSTQKWIGLTLIVAIVLLNTAGLVWDPVGPDDFVQNTDGYTVLKPNAGLIAFSFFGVLSSIGFFGWMLIHAIRRARVGWALLIFVTTILGATIYFFWPHQEPSSTEGK